MLVLSIVQSAMRAPLQACTVLCTLPHTADTCVPSSRTVKHSVTATAHMSVLTTPGSAPPPGCQRRSLPLIHALHSTTNNYHALLTLHVARAPTAGRTLAPHPVCCMHVTGLTAALQTCCIPTLHLSFTPPTGCIVSRRRCLTHVSVTLHCSFSTSTGNPAALQLY